MAPRIIIPLFGQEALAGKIAKQLDAQVGSVSLRQFPDTEHYVKLNDRVEGKSVIVLAALHEPDTKILPLLFLAQTLRSYGAFEVGLVAPYLPYMRQDQRFAPGECISSNSFADLISGAFDWLVTINPHLHRTKNLGDIYKIPTSVLHPTALVGDWIAEHIPNPLLLGSNESHHAWIEDVAKELDVPYLPFEKQRLDLKKVAVDVYGWQKYPDYGLVLIDDMISTASTMIAVVKELRSQKAPNPVCLGVHAIFAGDAYEQLKAQNPKDIVSCDTITHPTNQIEIWPLLIEGIGKFLPRVSKTL